VSATGRVTRAHDRQKAAVERLHSSGCRVGNARKTIGTITGSTAARPHTSTNGCWDGVSTAKA